MSRMWPGASPTVTVGAPAAKTSAAATIIAGCVVMCGMRREGSTRFGFSSTRLPRKSARANPHAASPSRIVLARLPS